MGFIPDDIIGLYRTPAPTSHKGLDVPAVVDDELSNLGYPEQSRLALLGNLGRENAWNPNTIFGGHNDPANAARNRGLMSWQGDRRTNLENYINQNGGNWQPTEQNLRLQTQFLDHELKSKYPKIHQAITNPDTDLPTVSRQLRNYINYVPQAPYNTPDSEYDVKNNRIWAEKAKARGLASFDPYQAYTGTGVAEPEFDPYSAYTGSAPEPPPVMPEAPATVDAQRTAASDPQSSRAGVLYPPGTPVPPINAASEMDIPIPGGQTLRVDHDSFARVNHDTGITVDDLQKGADYTPFIGGKADVQPGIGSLSHEVVHTTNAQGTELNSSGFSDPTQISVQAALDKLQFPNQDVQTSVVGADEVVAKRLLDQMRQIEPVPTTPNDVPSQTPQPQPQQPLVMLKDGRQVQVIKDNGKTAVVQEIKRDGSKGSVTIQPKRKFVSNEPQISVQDYNEEGTPSVPQQPSQSVVNANDVNTVDRAVAETIQVPMSVKSASDASDYVRKQLQAKYGGDFSKQGLKDYTPGEPVKVPYGWLKEAGIDINPLIQQKVAENRTENPQQDLRAVPYNFAKEDADAVNDVAKQAYGESFGGHVASGVGAVASGLNSIGNLVGGVADLINTYSPVTGATKEIVESQGKQIVHTGAENMIDNMKSFSQGLEDFAGHTGNKVQTGIDPISKEPIYQDTWPTAIVKYAGKTTGDLAALMLIPGGPVAAFPINEAAVTKIKGGSGTDVLKSITKGLVTGALFAGAGALGDLAGITKPLVKEGVTLGTIAGGTAVIGYVSGDKPTDILTSMLVNSAFHIAGALHGAVSEGKTIRLRDEQGNAVAAKIEPDGQIISVDATKLADIEMLQPKPTFAGASDSTAPAKPVDTTDPDIAENARVQQLAESNKPKVPETRAETDAKIIAETEKTAAETAVQAAIDAAKPPEEKPNLNARPSQQKKVEPQDEPQPEKAKGTYPFGTLSSINPHEATVTYRDATGKVRSKEISADSETELENTLRDQFGLERNKDAPGRFEVRVDAPTPPPSETPPAASAKAQDAGVVNPDKYAAWLKQMSRDDTLESRNVWNSRQPVASAEGKAVDDAQVAPLTSPSRKVAVIPEDVDLAEKLIEQHNEKLNTKDTGLDIAPAAQTQSSESGNGGAPSTPEARRQAESDVATAADTTAAKRDEAVQGDTVAKHDGGAERELAPELKPFENNKIVTVDKVQEARDVLKKIQFNTGLDPEAYQALVTIGAAHVEAGARKFADFSKRMVDEFGEKVKPHLEAVWNTVKGTYKDFGSEMDEPGKERGLSKTLEAAQLEKGNQQIYEPERIPGSKEVGRSIIADKGIDGAKEAVLSRSIKPNTNWASTGFAVMEHQQNEIAKVRSSDPAKADQLYKEHQDFVGDFTRLATENGQMSAGIRAVQEFAPDKLEYFANKASQKGRDKPLTRQESEKITDLGKGLTKERDIQKGLDQQIDKSTQADQEKAGKLPKKETYLDALERASNDAKTAILAKLGKLDLSGLKKEQAFEGQKGAIGEKKALPGDAELLAQYAAGRLHKVDTVEALDKEMVDTFGKDVEAILPDIHRRAYELRQEARITALEAKDNTSDTRRTILQEMRKEIKTGNEDAVSHLKQAIEDADKRQKTASQAYKEAVRSGDKEGMLQSRKDALEARQAKRDAEKVYKTELRNQATAYTTILSQAKKAERAGIAAERKAKREEERRSNFWDTPTRQIADEARTRLKDASPDDPNTMVDLASVGAEKFLPDTPGGTPRKGNISPARFYREMQEEYPHLVTNKNQKEVYKQSFQRITDTQNAARDASKLANASAEVTRLWKEQGIDVNTQALLIQKAASVKRDMQMRNAAAQEFARVSRPLYKVIASEIWHSPRSLMTSLNIHQGRQGLMTLLSHPYSITAKVSVPQSLRGLMASHEEYLRLTQELKDSPGYGRAVRSNVNFAELPEASATPKGFLEEDQLQGRWAQKLPWVRRSTQGFVLGMNAERLALFNRWSTLGEAHNYTEESNPEFYKAIGKLANDFTGRGQAPEAVERFLKTPVISELFFAPRLKVSQVMALNDLLNPFNYFGKNAKDPVLRNIKAKETLRIAAGAALLYSTLIMLGGKGTDDPDDPDFFKVKFGHTHYDLSGGVGGTLRFMYKFFKSIYGSIAGDKQSEYEQPLSIAGHFLRQKLGPWPGAAINYFEKKDVVGQPSNLKVSTDVPKMMHENIALKMVLPLIVNEIAEGVEDDGWKGFVKTAPASAFGFTEQTYAPSERSAKKALDEAIKKGKQADIEQAQKDLDAAQSKAQEKKTETKQERLANPPPKATPRPRARP